MNHKGKNDKKDKPSKPVNKPKPDVPSITPDDDSGPNPGKGVPPPGTPK